MSIQRKFLSLTLVLAVWPLAKGFSQDTPTQAPYPEATKLSPHFRESPPTWPIEPERVRIPAEKEEFNVNTGGMGGPGGKSPGYSVTWYPNSSLSDRPGELGFVRQNLNIGVPVWRADGDMILATVTLRNTLFDSDVLLPDTGRAFPRELWNVNLGLMYSHRFDNGWTGNLMIHGGSASDKPFHSTREMNVGALGFLRVPTADGRDAWLFSVFYSPVGNLNFPIPGLAYAWNPAESFRVNLGIPFSLVWKPTDAFTLNMSYFPLTNVNIRGTYRLSDSFSAYGGYEIATESYFLHDRIERRDRFLSFEQRILAGFRLQLWPRTSLDFEGGYAFDRYYGEGRNQGSDLRDRIDVSPGAFLASHFRVRF